MRPIALVALASLTLEDGRRVAVGEVFEVAPIEAAVLRYHKHVDFAPRKPSTPPITPSRPLAARHSRKS